MEASLTKVVSLIDSVVEGPVIVFGSLPPHARDLDLVVRPLEDAALRAAFRAAGWVNKGFTWARFAECRAEVVDLIPVSEWRISARAESDLFAMGSALPGAERVLAPHPAHVLLIMARRMARGTTLEGKRKARVEAAIGSDPGSWSSAGAMALEWRSTLALAQLKEIHDSGPVRPARTERARALAEILGSSGGKAWVGAARAVLPVPARPRIVAFSGLDGSGNTTQASALKGTLETLGLDARVHWSRLTFDPALERIARPVKALLRPLRWRRPTSENDESHARSEARTSEFRRSSGLLNLAWAFVVATANGIALRNVAKRRRGAPDVVVVDRFALDSIVEMEFRYGNGKRLPLHDRWLRLLAPRTTAAYFLDVPIEEAWDRKKDEFDPDSLAVQAARYGSKWKRMGYRRLDGTRARHQLCEEIARDVWTAL